VLIKYLTLNYIFANFWNAIWLLYQLLYMRVLKLTLGKIIFLPKFSLIFSILVWSVRMDLAYSPNASGPAYCLSGSVSSRRVCTKSGCDPYRYFSMLSFSASYTPLYFYWFIMSCCVFFSRISPEILAFFADIFIVH